MRGGNEFDPAVMPSAKAARTKERRMLGALPVYVFVVVVIMVSILAIVFFAAGSPKGA